VSATATTTASPPATYQTCIGTRIIEGPKEPEVHPASRLKGPHSVRTIGTWCTVARGTTYPTSGTTSSNSPIPSSGCTAVLPVATSNSANSPLASRVLIGTTPSTASTKPIVPLVIAVNHSINTCRHTIHDQPTLNRQGGSTRNHKSADVVVMPGGNRVYGCPIGPSVVHRLGLQEGLGAGHRGQPQPILEDWNESLGNA